MSVLRRAVCGRQPGRPTWLAAVLPAATVLAIVVSPAGTGAAARSADPLVRAQPSYVRLIHDPGTGRLPGSR